MMKITSSTTSYTTNYGGTMVEHYENLPVGTLPRVGDQVWVYCDRWEEVTFASPPAWVKDPSKRKYRRRIYMDGSTPLIGSSLEWVLPVEVTKETAFKRVVSEKIPCPYCEGKGFHCPRLEE